MTTKLKELETLRNIFWCLVLAIFVAIFFYVYFINKTVHNVADRHKIQAEISRITSKLSELEFKSVSIRNKISAEYAYSLGFKDATNQRYISKKAEQGTISLRTTP